MDRPPRQGRAAQPQLAGALARRVEHGVAPLQRVAHGARRGEGEHREHEALGVPEGMAVVAAAGEALGRDRAALVAHRGLEDVEHREAQRLLELGVAVHLDVGALPVAVERLALRLGQAVEALGQAALEARVHLVAEPVDALLRGPVVGEQLVERAAGGPGSSSADSVTRPRSSSDWVSVLTSPSCSSTCSMPDAMTSPERLVSCAEHHAHVVVHREQRPRARRSAHAPGAGRRRGPRPPCSPGGSTGSRRGSAGRPPPPRTRSRPGCAARTTPAAASAASPRDPKRPASGACARARPERKSSLRSWWITSPRCTSSGSSSTWRRMILPSVTLTIDWPSSAKP